MKAIPPIPQIQIRSPYGEDIPHADTLYTDSKGEFNYSFNGFFRSDNIPLLLTDIDGEQNGGSYAPDSVSVSFKDVDVTGGDGGWYLGEATKEITIVLKEKKEENKEINDYLMKKSESQIIESCQLVTGRDIGAIGILRL